MQRILIAGCGYVGLAAAKLFRENAWCVTAWTRSGSLADCSVAETFDLRAVDLRELEQVRQNSFPSDLVVHCASSRGGDADQYRRIYRDGVVNLLQSFPGARIVFTSSTSVYGQRDGSWVDENSPAEPGTTKGEILREAEEIVLAHDGIVLRLGGIYGPGRSFLLQSVMHGAAALPSPERYVNQIHRDDVASAILSVAQQTNIAPRRIFNVVDDKPSSNREILAWLSSELRRPLANSVERSVRKRGASNKRVQNGRLRALGWKPRYPSYKEGFTESVLRVKS